MPAFSKVPEITLGFWIIKVLATTIGETGGDAVTMSLLHADRNARNGGYLIGTGIFMGVFIATVVAQIAMTKFHPLIYWTTIVATTTVGQRWPISQTVRLVLAMPADHRSSLSFS
jgi:uncharacterized membrane-anchored protein